MRLKMIWNKRLSRSKYKKRQEKIAKKVEKLIATKKTDQIVEYTKPLILDIASRTLGGTVDSGLVINKDLLYEEHYSLGTYFDITMRELIKDGRFLGERAKDDDGYFGYITPEGRKWLEDQKFWNKAKKVILPILTFFIKTIISAIITAIVTFLLFIKFGISS